MAQERLAPDAIISSSGLDVSGGISVIQDDPNSPDANWFTSSGSNGSLRVSFGTPAANPDTGAGVQNFNVYLRKSGTGGGDPTFTAELRETGGGTALQTLATGTLVTSATGQLFTLTWDAANLGTADGSAVELLLTFSKGGGGPNERNVEVGAVEWNCERPNAISGTADQTLGALNQSGSGTVFREISGTAEQTLPSLNQSAQGSVNLIQGTIAQTIAPPIKDIEAEPKPGINSIVAESGWATSPTVADIENDTTWTLAASNTAAPIVEFNFIPPVGKERIPVATPPWSTLQIACRKSNSAGIDPTFTVRLKRLGVTVHSTSGTITSDTLYFAPLTGFPDPFPHDFNYLDYTIEFEVTPSADCSADLRSVRHFTNNVEFHYAYKPVLGSEGSGKIGKGGATGTASQTIAPKIAAGYETYRAPSAVHYFGDWDPAHKPAAEDLPTTQARTLGTGWAVAIVEFPAPLGPLSSADPKAVANVITGNQWNTTFDDTRYRRQMFRPDQWPVDDYADGKEAGAVHPPGSGGGGGFVVSFATPNEVTWPVRLQAQLKLPPGSDDSSYLQSQGIRWFHEGSDGFNQVAVGTVSASTSVTGTADQTLASLTQSASGDVTGEVQGTGNQSLASVSQSASGDVTGVVEGAALQSLQALVQSASGTVYLEISGTASQALTAPAQSASGDVTGIVEGSGAQTLQSLVQDAAGLVYFANAGIGSQTLSAIVQSAAGDITGVVEGAGAQTLAGINQSASGDVVGVREGPASQTLQPVQQSAAGTAYRAISGSADQALSGIAQSGAGAVSDNSREGVGDQALATATQSGVGDVVGIVEGAASQSLSGLTQSGSGIVYLQIFGVADQALQPVAQSGAGQVSDNSREGVGSQALSAVVQSGVGDVTGIVEGAADHALPAILQSAAGTVYLQISGTGTQVLASVIQSGTGSLADNSREGIGDQQLPSITQSAAGDVTGIVEGSGSQTLPLALQSGSGTVYLQIFGTADQALPAVLQSATGQISDNSRTGIADQILASVAQAAIGDVVGVREGTAQQTLPSLNQSASGDVGKQVTGIASQSLASLTQAATGGVADNSRTGTVQQTLASLSQGGAGNVAQTIQGSAAQVLQAFQQAASGDVGLTTEGTAQQVLAALVQSGLGDVTVTSTRLSASIASNHEGDLCSNRTTGIASNREV